MVHRKPSHIEYDQNHIHQFVQHSFLLIKSYQFKKKINLATVIFLCSAMKDLNRQGRPRREFGRSVSLIVLPFCSIRTFPECK